MEVWIEIHPKNAKKIVRVLKEFGFETHELKPELFLAQDQIIRMGNPLFRVKKLFLQTVKSRM
jgi:hypothetical protein